MSAVLYLDTSAVLRAVVERGVDPAVERTLDALHLATYVLARRQLGDEISLLSTDARLVEASGIA